MHVHVFVYCTEVTNKVHVHSKFHLDDIVLHCRAFYDGMVLKAVKLFCILIMLEIYVCFVMHYLYCVCCQQLHQDGNACHNVYLLCELTTQKINPIAHLVCVCSSLKQTYKQFGCVCIFYNVFFLLLLIEFLELPHTSCKSYL